MNIRANFPNLSGMLKRLWTGASPIEVLPPEAEPEPNHDKQDIIDLMNRIGDYLNDSQGDHPFVDKVTTMQSGYIGVIMSNPEKTASQIVAYNVDEDKNGNPQVNKETTRIIKADEDDFPEKSETQTFKPARHGGEDRIADMSQTLIEDVADTFGIDQIALTAAVQGKGVVDNAHDGATYAAITAE